MASDRTQHYGNHTHFTPLYHFFAAPLGIVYLIWAVRRAMSLRDMESHFDLLGAVVLCAAIAVSRTMSLRVQDRLIRMEERTRLARVLPADLQPHIARLRVGHLVALRFASETEVADLVRAIIADPSITPKEIKQRVKDWQGDYLRT